jgi:cell shape-determining protein MreC
MTATTTQPSESLVGSLCREMADLRQRWQQLAGLLGACREERLILRLRQEAERLQQRRLELQRLARQLSRLPLRDPLGVAFLLALSVRPLSP